LHFPSLPYQTSPLIQLGRDRPTVFSFPAGSNIPFSYELKSYVPAGIKGMHRSSIFKTFKAVNVQVVVFFVLALKMVAACSFEKLVFIHKTTQCQNSEDHRLNKLVLRATSNRRWPLLNTDTAFKMVAK
jgi:hypothetical protein